MTEESRSCRHCEFVAKDWRGLVSHVRWTHPDHAVHKPKKPRKPKKFKNQSGLPRLPKCSWCSKSFASHAWWYKHSLRCPDRPQFVAVDPTPPVRVWYIDHDGGQIIWISYAMQRDEAEAEFARFRSMLIRPLRQIEKSPPVYQAQIALGLISAGAE